MNKSEKPNYRFRFPTGAVAWTLLAAAIVFVVQNQLNWLDDNVNIDLGLFNILTMVLVFVTVVVWLCWLVFFSGMSPRWRYGLGLLAILALAGFISMFKAVFDGSVKFVRFEPRLWSVDKEFSRVASAPDPEQVDLTKIQSNDFTQFLGPGRNATLPDRRLDPDWKNSGPELIWKQPVGEGWSGFVAAGGYAITQEQRDQDECVTCYNIQSGQLVWIQKIPHRHEDTVGLGRVGPRATPTIDAGRVYVQGGTGWLQCLDGATGSVIWKIDLPGLLDIEMISMKNGQGMTYEFEDSPLAWGRAGSPLIVGEQLIVPGGGPNGGPFRTLLSFNKTTGQLLWQGGDSMIAYGSPTLTRLLGQEQIVIVAEAQAMGFDPANGAVLWSTPREGVTSANANCSQVTPVSDNQILLSKGYSLGGELVELQQMEGQVTTETKWKNPRVLKTKFNNPVILHGFAYSLSEGFLECTEIQTGQRKWKKRRRFGNGQLLLVGDHLLVHSEQGVLFLVAAKPDAYEELGQYKTVDGVCWNTICLAGPYLLVRSELEAACLKLSFLDESAAVTTTGSSTEAPVQNPDTGGELE